MEHTHTRQWTSTWSWRSTNLQTLIPLPCLGTVTQAILQQSRAMKAIVVRLQNSRLPAQWLFSNVLVVVELHAGATDNKPSSILLSLQTHTHPQTDTHTSPLTRSRQLPAFFLLSESVWVSTLASLLHACCVCDCVYVCVCGRLFFSSSQAVLFFLARSLFLESISFPSSFQSGSSLPRLQSEGFLVVCVQTECF